MYQIKTSKCNDLGFLGLHWSYWTNYLISPAPPLQNYFCTYRNTYIFHTEMALTSERWRLKTISLWLSCSLSAPLHAASSAHQHRSKRYWQLNKFSTWKHISWSMPPHHSLLSTPIWPTEVLNNYIMFQTLIWLRAILLVSFHQSCFHTFVLVNRCMKMNHRILSCCTRVIIMTIEREVPAGLMMPLLMTDISNGRY